MIAPPGSLSPKEELAFDGIRPLGGQRSTNERRKLSTIEHMLDGNITCFVRLDVSLDVEQLRSALLRVQRQHPALRALIREQTDGLYYEADSAPEIPLRIVPRASADDYRRHCQIELAEPFPYHQPQLRVVLLRSEWESDLLLTTSHRICDGMSILTIAKDVLRSLYSEDEPVPYTPITIDDIIGSYQPSHPRRRMLAARLLNGVLHLVPRSRPTPENKEHYLEWRASRELSTALIRSCKAQNVSVHAALLVALDRALLAVFGNKSPKWICNQIDPRRGRFAALKDGMLFFGGGSFKMRTAESRETGFWTRTCAVNQDMRRQIEQEVLDIPSRFQFLEMLRPLSDGQLHSILRLAHALNINRRPKHFALSNLGNIAVTGSDAPFQLKDLRLYVHSFKTRALGWFTYTANGEMRFYCVSNENCMSRSEVAALSHEFMMLLQHHVMEREESPRYE